jgi:hypothetical protein
LIGPFRPSVLKCGMECAPSGVGHCRPPGQPVSRQRSNNRQIPKETEISDAETFRTKAALSGFLPGLETGARLRKAATPRHFRRQPGKSPFAGTGWWARQDSKLQPDHQSEAPPRTIQRKRQLPAYTIGFDSSPDNNSPARMYRFNIASEACPVCALIFQDGTPAAAALVANPARSEWPE